MQEICIQAPTLEPVTLSLAKSYLRVTHDLEDILITNLISSARKMCEDAMRISICPQRWLVAFKLPYMKSEGFGLPWRLIDDERIFNRCLLPRPPVTSINTVSLMDRVGNQTPYTNYVFDDPTNSLLWSDPYTFIHGFPVGPYPPNRIEIDYNTGYPLYSVVNPGQEAPDGQADVTAPKDIILAILVTIASAYENRGDDETTIPKKAAQLLRPYYNSIRGAG